mmetsp:Transcript_16815/g.48665  ORF Transcript_16815/g.48665 Transcript_16815/m.48665 type:complete len:212 (+) Transcript_16815:1055-1690(+)
MRRGRLSGARPANAPLHRPRARWRPTWTRPAALPTASWVPSCWGASSRFSACCSLVAPRLGRPARSVRSAPRRTRSWRWLATTYPSSARASPTAPRTPPRSTHRRPPTASPQTPRLSRRWRPAARRCRRARRFRRRRPRRRATPTGPSRPRSFHRRRAPQRASPSGRRPRSRAAITSASGRPPRSIAATGTGPSGRAASSVAPTPARRAPR